MHTEDWYPAALRAALGVVAAASLGCNQGDASELRQPVPVEVDVPTASEGAAPETPAVLHRRAKHAGLSALPDLEAPDMQTDTGLARQAQVELGFRLFFEKRLSAGRVRSCSSCHSLESYGVQPDDASDSTGSAGNRYRDVPSVYNAVLHAVQFWDGRVQGVADQVKVHILEAPAMGLSDEAQAVRAVNAVRSYAALFKRAFPGDPRPVTFEHIVQAITRFEEQLLTPSRFDAFLAGDTRALNEQERRGLGLFLDAGCTACHRGPALGGQMFHKLGVLKAYDTEDPGRAGLTGKERDKHVFKVPGLRNVAMTGPYLHDGSVDDLAGVVQLMAKHQTPKGRLTEKETADLVAFLRALTGELPKHYVAPSP